MCPEAATGFIVQAVQRVLAHAVEVLSQELAPTQLASCVEASPLVTHLLPFVLADLAEAAKRTRVAAKAGLEQMQPLLSALAPALRQLPVLGALAMDSPHQCIVESTHPYSSPGCWEWAVR